MTDRWIWIPNWDGKDGFQHYTGRDPIWIKNYTRLLSHDAYTALTLGQRGLLHGIWLEYAKSHRKLPESTLKLSRRLSGRVTQKSLTVLAHAGFIQIIDSATLAERLQDASPEKRREEKREKTVVVDLGDKRGVHVWQETDEPPDLSFITGGAA